MFFGEVISSLPDQGKPLGTCEEEWDVTKGLLDSRMAVLTEYATTETEQKDEFTKTKETLDEDIKTA